MMDTPHVCGRCGGDERHPRRPAVGADGLCADCRGGPA